MKVVLTAAALLGACTGGGPGRDAMEAGLGAGDLPYASELIAFEPGAGAGFGQDELPDVVLGPPRGKGEQAGSLDVLALGAGGEIVLGFGTRAIEDGPGADFVVFENAFWAGGDPSAVFAEPGEVAVSPDGDTWHTFECDRQGDGSGAFPGCAGWTPTLEYDGGELVPIDPELSGGDRFDLAELGLSTARYVRIRDLSEESEGTNAGFDLDAIGLVHFADEDQL